VVLSPTPVNLVLLMQRLKMMSMLYYSYGAFSIFCHKTIRKNHPSGHTLILQIEQNHRSIP